MPERETGAGLLDEVSFRDPSRMRPSAAVLEQLPANALRIVRVLLPSLPDPDDAVHYLKRLIVEAPAGSVRIAADTTALRYALTVFSWSRFLSEAVIAHPDWLLEIAEAKDLHRGFLAEDYERELGDVVTSLDIATFRRRRMLRIVLRDALKIAEVAETAEDLSNLADAVLNVTLRSVRNRIEGKFEFSVVALGKLGGRELNYSSDIDLMFVYTGDGAAASLAAGKTTELLSAYTPEGMSYRVDLRLRPDGRHGEVVQSLEGAKRYYATRGRDWELQMLIKARVAAGDPGPGQAMLESVEPLIYKTTTDFRTVEAVSETRARIHEKQRKRTKQAGLDVKLARGGIRDIEFLVQCLQRLHGGKDSWVRHGGTLLALSRLLDKGHVSGSEYSRLASAYQFLRHLEHRLQFDEDRQTHTLPLDPEDLDLLARKMPSGMALPSASALQRQLDQHFSNVQDLYDRVMSGHGQELILPPMPPDIAAPPVENDLPSRSEFPSPNLSRYLDLRAPLLSRMISGGAVLRSQNSFESFLEKVVATPQLLSLLERDGELTRSTIDLFEHSQYFADQLVRHPDLLIEVEESCGEKQGRTGFRAPRDAADLRRYFREQMVRIQSDSVYHRVSVFLTLKRTSELAESIIAAAYEIALTDALRTAPPARRAFTLENQMMVIALGRLGTREFDLASDADLNFVIPDSDANEAHFWTGVAERLINVISAYTGDGVVFTIDTRLRPNGRSGALVQTEATYKDYFAQQAQAWEGISYMKARAVAGDVERGTRFLGELQQIDYERYGQGGRSRDELAHMRSRLEREQGARNPLKAAAGGYFDIDFIVMYLRLRDAGSFYKVLNTPRRIAVIESAGNFNAAEAGFLRDAATFYRAIDHGLRVSTGHAAGRLPTNPAQVAVLTELVRRWTPPNLHEGSLEAVARRIRHETRAFFRRVFQPS